MVRIQCPYCHEQTSFGPFCSLCGGHLEPRHDDLRGLDYFGFYDRAKTMKANFGQTILATLQILHMPDTGKVPRMKDIHIDRNSSCFLYSSSHSSPQRLVPGNYSPQELFSEHGGLGSSFQREDDVRWVMLCGIRTLPITATFSLPDYPHLEEALSETAQDVTSLFQSIRQALRTLELVDSNGFSGGAQTQMSLRCVDPELLSSSLILEHIEQRPVSPPPRSILHPPEPEPEPKSLLNKLGDWVRKMAGRERKPEDPPIPVHLSRRKYTLGDFYDRIRLELQLAIRQAVKGLTAQYLQEMGDEGRNEVQRQVRETMDDTLRNVGLEIERVSTFQFFCPELAKQRQEESQIELAKRQVEMRKEQARINKDSGKILSEQHIHDMGLEAEETREQIKLHADTSALQDEKATEAMGRKHAMDSAQQDHRRRQQEANERSKLTTEMERRKTEDRHALEHEEKVQALEMRKKRELLAIAKENQEQKFSEVLRLLAVLKEAGQATPEMVRLILARDNPQLAAMWVAGQQAQGTEQKLLMQEEFRKQLEEAWMKNSQSMISLGQEVLRLLNRTGTQQRQSEPPPSLPPSSHD